MSALHSHLFICVIFLFNSYIINGQDIAKLPHCDGDIKHIELTLVSTLDGFFTALTSTGNIAWQIETGPGSLLSSTIHKLELTNNGQWIRIIPSLSGSLYKFDGNTIDPIPISADTLLASSFRYSDDLLIAGGREIRTYGLHLNSGTLLYECSLKGCTNRTDYSDDFEDVIIIERKTHTVRAVEPRTGLERWNFTVGQHNVKIPFIHCVNPNFKPTNMNISAVLPEGLLTASNSNKADILWQHRFESPIVSIWKWNGQELLPLNLFNSPPLMSVKVDENTASIYVGMHNKQLYIHESPTMQDILQLKQTTNNKYSVTESQSVTQIPWKPIPAINMGIDNHETDYSTALSILYASSYVNGNGYYLYAEDKPVCENNSTNTTSLPRKHMETIRHWWKEAMVVALVTIIICHLMYRYRIFGFGHPLKVEITIENSIGNNKDNLTPHFISKYLTEFEPISCLGKGGFGIVFKAKKKFDEYDYAVKRITLPNKPSAKDRMMREVKALAKLDHPNIVRYYNAWLEYPPQDWQQQHDQQWLKDFSIYMDSSYISRSFSEKNNASSNNVPSFKFDTFNSDSLKKAITTDDNSLIIFKNSKSQESNTINIDDDLKSETNSQSRSYNSTTFQAPVYLYIQMQLCCKESLKDWLAHHVMRERHQVLHIFKQIVEAVKYVHFRELIHRDLKQYIFSLDGHIKVGDFGLVTNIKDYTEIDDELTSLAFKKSYTNAVGTHLYMSPEQLIGNQYDFKVDIYSLGIIYFELLIPFRTEMERINVLTTLRERQYPDDISMLQKDYQLLDLMISHNPNDRPNATEIGEKLASNEYFDKTNELKSSVDLKNMSSIKV